MDLHYLEIPLIGADGDLMAFRTTPPEANLPPRAMPTNPPGDSDQIGSTSERLERRRSTTTEPTELYRPQATSPTPTSTVDAGPGHLTASKPSPSAEKSGDDTVLLNGVNKSFGDVTAITDLNLRIPRAQISVLLGPNGAGKTTAIRLITGALTPDTGAATVFGLSPTSEDGEEVRRRCGVVTAKPSLYDRLNGQDNLQYAADLYGLSKADAPKRILEAAEQFDIVDALNQQVGGYSTGMKTRLALARAVLHRPDLLLLDEPTSGLDPESAHSVLSMVREMTSDGKTVLMCTHLLLEAEGLADQIIILQNGSNLLSGVPDHLATGYWPNRIVELRTATGSDLDQLKSRAGTISYERDGNTARVELETTANVADLVSELARSGVGLEAVIPFEPTLEDLYLRIRRDDQLATPAPGGSETEMTAKL